VDYGLIETLEDVQNCLIRLLALRRTSNLSWAVTILRDTYGTSLPLSTLFGDLLSVFQFLILALIGSMVLNGIRYIEEKLEKLHSEMPKAN
jgi:hypothetical protein